MCLLFRVLKNSEIGHGRLTAQNKVKWKMIYWDRVPVPAWLLMIPVFILLTLHPVVSEMNVK